ncbi:PilC/PilY family type IV pilus protein [uncultured Desulfosarcina sp.]|uniref:pilus assembly protein n=1 Tax=uncultured Desulfosarcina sp. TaxID=218289 RepID=UPI0029C8F80F|nr:PilC/PilY family type IV pilus protein [uncultured Desulfosarcina sp.]
MNKKIIIFLIMVGLINGLFISGTVAVANATPPVAVDYEAYPPFLAASVPPLVMLVMGRNHKLYYEAYNDASDLDGDGTLDITYKPDDIDYYGYFDSFKYYVYDTTDKRFEPVGITADKKVPAGVNLYWSGDFLNYLTMSRMDAVRKVLYGGMRSTDSTTETVLERAYIPQDAHSWGKEYTSVAHDGYDIRDYTPLSLPVVGTRHLFASTSLADAAAATYAPLLRVLPNNTHRIWDWVSKERPVCDDSLETPAAAGSWQIVPASTTAGIRAMTQTTYPKDGSHPADHAAFNTLVSTYAIAGSAYGTGSAPTINGSGNPYGVDSNYLTIFEGTLTVPADGDYTFSVDGDDAEEFIIDGGDGVFDDVDDTVVAGFYSGHGFCNCNIHSGTITLTAGEHKFQFRHEEGTGDDSYYLRWELNSAASEITDLVVRVKVADSAVGLETNCKQYPNGNYKPIGLLQRHGESNSMYFGLLSGSYTKNTSGGVLRKKVGTITDEIVANTGQFTALNGIIKTINQFRIVDFNYGDHTYNSNCGWITTRPISEGECRMWGNPVGEMMYETLRYFAGEGSPTADFTYSDANDNAAGLDLTLPKPGWNNPYDTSDGGFEYCAKPFMLVLSDINPTFDSDQLPGAYSGFGSKPAETIGNAGTSLDVEEISDTIFSNEMTDGNRFIGQQANNFDGACTEKYVDSFGNIRGLCPEEPTKQGSYYSAAVANYGWKEDMNTVDGKQAVRTYAVGLASPLPRIEIPLNGKTITLVPFAKSVGGSSISSAEGSFQPTNTIVDFFIEELHPYYGRFRINYEDVEQGADHDMDAIVLYEYQLVDSSDNPVDASNIGDAVALNITLTSEYAAGGIDQHMGYIISGTKNDGIYLEVKDVGGANVDYFLDTPNNATDLPFITTRRFEADPDGGSLTAGLLTNPLWYAAKWGGFDDENDNGIPDLTDEWDKDGDGNPDTYFYVVNPLKLEEQLNKSFADILEKAASGTAASVLATNSEGEGHLLQAYFKPRVTTASGNELTWQGYLQSLWVDPLGNLREDSNSNHRLDLTNTTDSVLAGANVDKIIAYTTDVNGDTKLIRYTTHYLYHPKNGLTSDCRLGYIGETCPDLTDSNNYELKAINAITPIFEAGDKLRQRTADTRKIFTFIDGDGVDEDGDGLIDQSGEDEGGAVKIVGQVLSPTTDLPFDNIDELIAFHEDNLAKLKPFLGLSDSTAWDYLDPSTGPDHDTRVKNLINYIRGKDSADLVGNPDTRIRTTDEGTVWKLGDIVNSTPVSVSKAPDYYHLIYGDESFQTYLDFTKDRETVVYVGANDGMLHAFTSWYYNASGQYTQPAATTEGLGDELWAYIPQTLLPHLKFLAAPDYAHTFYVDLKPKLFDARIFYADATHPGGWGTILLVGLNMGGKHIWAEGDFDGDTSTLETRNFYPTYICMDVTNPRAPRLLWERSYENLAMSTSFPAAVAVGAKRTVSGGKYVWYDSQWSVAFGSGPTEYDGTSNQSGYMFVVDLKTGKPFGYNDGTVTHDWLFTTGTANTSMNSPTAFDKNLTYNVDSIYFGSIADAGTTPPSLEGKVYKINTHTVGVDTADPTFGVPSETPTDWTMWPMADSPGPITAPIALSTDKKNNVWAFFGTGRYQSNADKMDENQQYFFGVKDPYFNKDHVTSPDDYYYNTAKALEVDWSTDLFDATGYSVHTNRTVTGGVAGVTDWSTLLTEARKYDGWYHELEAVAGNPSERVISKATILGGIVFFPGYTPNDDICGFGGDTNFYANYYETGTAYYKHILPGTITTVTQGSETTELVNSKYFVGHGAPPPAAGFHVGREKGATAFLQMSTGEVVKINVETAFPIKSGIAAWRDKNN